MNDNKKNRANFDYGIMQKRKAHPTLRGEPPCFFFLIDKEETESRQSFEPKLLNKLILFSLVKLVFRLHASVY